VKVILVNIFGGCPYTIVPNVGVIQGDMIAKGILSAMKELPVPVPVVVRIQGTNGKLGMQIVPTKET
jgi:succinyl-CoA synthetase beta subunit